MLAVTDVQRMCSKKYTLAINLTVLAHVMTRATTNVLLFAFRWICCRSSPLAWQLYSPPKLALQNTHVFAPIEHSPESLRCLCLKQWCSLPIFRPNYRMVRVSFPYSELLTLPSSLHWSGGNSIHLFADNQLSILSCCPCGNQLYAHYISGPDISETQHTI
jgi:hypothetical protein